MTTPTETAPAAERRQYYYGTGKRKSAIARVRLYPDGDQFTVNDRPLQEVLPWANWQARAQEPLAATGMLGKFAVTAKLEGGGISAWADALRHGIARALVQYDATLKTALRKHGLLTRDPRVKERKKYGLKRARRAPQYTKR